MNEVKYDDKTSMIYLLESLLKMAKDGDEVYDLRKWLSITSQTLDVAREFIKFKGLQDEFNDWADGRIVF